MKLLDWIEDRTGLTGPLRSWLAYPVSGGAAFRHTLGWLLLALFLVQCLTGAVLTAYYSPSVTDAWASVAYIETQVAGGAWIRGIHHLGTSLMVILALLHAGAVVWRGAYKAPREANWWVGLALLGLILAYPMTGYTLVWDQLAYWSAKVRSGITASLPIAGPLLEDIAIGGNDLGNFTLTRTYAMHVVALPALTFLMIFAHLALFFRKGYTPAPGKETRTEAYGMRQGLLDLSVVAVVIGTLSAAAWRLGAPLEAPADSTVSFTARPEWYFLALNQLLKYFHGPAQILGTVVIPGLASSFLLALPFLDRGATTRVRPRLPWLAGSALVLLGLAALTGLNVSQYHADPHREDNEAFAAREAERALALVAEGVPPQGGAYMMAHDPLVRGERVFRQRCRSCHALEGFLPEEPKGPDLTAYGSKAWLRQLLRDPEGPRFFGRTEEIEGMPAFDDLSEEELGKLVELLYALRDAEDGIDVEEHEDAELITEAECADCHDFEDDYAVEGPAMLHYLSTEWTRAMVDDPGADHLYGEVNEMPAFETRISEEDRDAVVVFLESLADRAPRDAWPFVDEPLSPREADDEEVAADDEAADDEEADEAE